MLSGESANSPYFEQAVHIMSRTVTNAELSRNYNVLYQSIRNSIINEHGKLSVGESVASSAVKTAIDVQAKLIVILSDSGKLANYVSKFRPSVSSLVLTPDLVVARQTGGLLLGMHSIHCDSLENAQELIEETMYELSRSGMMSLRQNHFHCRPRRIDEGTLDHHYALRREAAWTIPRGWRYFLQERPSVELWNLRWKHSMRCDRTLY